MLNTALVAHLSLTFFIRALANKIALDARRAICGLYHSFIYGQGIFFK